MNKTNNYKTIVKVLMDSKENDNHIVPCSKQFLRLCADAIEELTADREMLKNELCLRCGKYREAHMGSCDGCRWYE